MEADSRQKERHLETAEDVNPDAQTGGVAAREQRLAEVARAGHLFDFFKLVDLLERLHGTETRAVSRRAEVCGELRFRPDASVVFPASDIKRVIWDRRDPDRVTLELSFLGLYGFDSPMPAYFHREIALDSRKARPLRDFLDIFNHRLYSFFYLSWKKFRAQLWVTNDATDPAARRYMSVGGIGTKGALVGVLADSLRVMAFASLLGARVRNASGLRQLIAGCMPGYLVDIKENAARWVNLTQRPKLGRGNGADASLGDSATIGERAHDVSGKFRVILGPLDLRQFQECLPGGRGAQILRALVNLYVTDLLDYEVELRLRTSEVPAVRLGDPSRLLGFSTWLRQPAAALTSRIVTY